MASEQGWGILKPGKQARHIRIGVVTCDATVLLQGECGLYCDLPADHDEDGDALHFDGADGLWWRKVPDGV